MNKRFILIFFTLALIVMAGALPYRQIIVPVVEAQIPGAGAQRAPSINIDRTDRLLLMMSTATKPPSAGTPGSQIFFTQSTNGGLNWDNFPVTRNLSNSNGEAFGPSVAVNRVGKVHIYITYHDNRNGTTQVYLLRSLKNAKFKKARNITPNDGGAFAPRIALDSAESLNIVWYDLPAAHRRVVFTRSTDLGDTFTELVDVSRSAGNAFDPEIAVDPNDNIHVIWQDEGSGISAIMYARSTDGGNTFSEPKKISGAGAAAEPQIKTSSSGQINVVWNEVVEDGSSQAFFSRSTDGGDSFVTPLNLSNNPGADIHKTVVTAFENVVYVAYNNDEDRSRQAYVLKSSDNGQSFGDPVQISNATRNRGRAHSVSMAVDSTGTLHVTWIDSSILGNDEGLLFYSRTSNGRNYTVPQQILAIVIG
ncbi:MAG: sialidase family protein [Acidobacteriota bacterium]